MTRIAIIGAGPSGLTLARLLLERRFGTVTLFESEDRPGGKSLTVFEDGPLIEMGTCYTTLSHTHVKRWMRQFGIRLRQIGPMLFDGDDFMNYVRQGDGPPLARQAIRFLREGSRLRRKIERGDLDPATIEEAAMPTLDWLAQRNLPKMERFLHRVVTINGYGFLDEVAAVQTHRWVDLSLVLSGMFNQLHMPEAGWSEFWRRLSDGMDVRLASPVTGIERDRHGATIHSRHGAERFDQVVCAMPLDDFALLTDGETEAERVVNQSVEWQGYTTSLVAVEEWFQAQHIQGFSSTVQPGAGYGHLLGARREASEPELGGQLYVIGQLSRGLEPDELREIAIAQLEERKVSVTNLILQRCWKYFPQYDRQAIRAGLLQTMRDMQGEACTWYTGATFSHEAVSNVTHFNAALARQMVSRPRTGEARS